MNTFFLRSLLSSVAFMPPDGAGGGDVEPGDIKELPADGAGGGGGAAGDKGGDKGAAGDKSFLSDDKSLKDPPGAPTTMPDNWRDYLAGEDKDARKLLDRYKAPSELGKALREQSVLISKGAGKALVRPADDKPEELKVWREQQGIPAEPTGYTLPDAVVKRFTDADKPAMEMFTAGMHAHDMPPTALSAALDVYANMQEAIKAGDRERSIQTQDALRQEWGADFKTNVSAARNFAETAIPGVNWLEARLADGRRMGDVPEVVSALVDLAKLKFGDTAFVGEAATKVTEARFDELRALQSDPKSAYYTDGGKLRSELMGLVDAKAARERTRRPSGAGDREE